MTKRMASFLLCLCLLLSAALPANAKERETPQSMQFTVSSLDSFLTLTEKCRLDSYSENLRVCLNTDLDLTGTGFEGIPVFGGIFEGNGHTIKGLSIAADGSTQGLFRYLTDTAVVQDLNVIGTVRPGGSRSEAGGIAGSNAGQILNCTFTGRVTGNEYIGGIAGINEVSGIIENCRMTGGVYGNHFVGGMAGKNSGVIRGCENEARINDTAQENTVALSDITLDALMSSESANTVTDIGGIAGSSMGVIRECVNCGSVGYQHMGYNIGGIAGTQSGAILNCENNGQIQGRKEVGGIVGQMEPTALIEYEEDALQILQRQLDSMGSTVSATVSNVQNTGDAIISQVGTLQSHVWNAKEAVDTLLPSKEDPELPDQDTIQAAQNTISSSISGMSQTLQGMSATTYSSMGALSTNLYALQNQINAMRSTLGNVSETLGGSITDVSDRDTELDLTGKVAYCVNQGSVLADRNAGGIAGAIAMENDLDPEEDWDISGNNSLNFESELRAVILNCSNTAQVTGRKQNVGGIAGWQSMGLVKESGNSGTVDAEGADHAGGISGQSTGFIRACSAKCEISGSSYVGGIAGSASIATDCRSMVQIHGGTEKLGAILGDAEENRTEEEEPISGNLYLTVSRDIGAVDGISYAGKAQPVERVVFLALENLPEMFRNATIRFRYGNGQERSFTVPLGGEFSADWIPPIPPKSGYAASWEGLEEKDLSEVLFEMTFEVLYSGKTTVIQSENAREDQPILLLQGSFTENAQLELTESDAPVPLESGETLVEAWSFTTVGAESLTTARFRLSGEQDAEHVKLLVRNSDQTWRETEFTPEGSYLVFPLESGDNGFALIRTPEIPWVLIAAAGGALVIGLTGILLYRKKRTKK